MNEYPRDFRSHPRFERDQKDLACHVETATARCLQKPLGSTHRFLTENGLLGNGKSNEGLGRGRTTLVLTNNWAGCLEDVVPNGQPMQQQQIFRLQISVADGAAMQVVHGFEYLQGHMEEFGPHFPNLQTWREQ